MSLTKADHRSALVRPSPNFGERKDGKKVTAIILHYTGMPDGKGAEDWLCNSDSEVSSHYLVHEDGRIVQMVAEADRAWHAGKSYWHGERDLNSVSVGIEIVNPGHILGYRPFPAKQISAVIRLCRGIALRHGVTPAMVLAHSDIAPGRKTDPGPYFSWGRLRRLLAENGRADVLARIEPEGAPNADDGALMRWPFPLAVRAG